MFRCATFLFAVAKVYLFLHSANFSLFFFEEQSKILGSTGKSGLAGELDNYMRNNYPQDVSILTRIERIERIERISMRILGARQKHQKPLAVDADVSYEPLMMCPSVNPSSKLGYFQAATPSTLLVLASIARR